MQPYQIFPSYLLSTKNILNRRAPAVKYDHTASSVGLWPLSGQRFSSVILLNFLLKFNRYWTTFETVAEIERDCTERQICMGD